MSNFLLYTKRCNSQARFEAWQRAGGVFVKGLDRGCGLNALLFLEIITRRQAEQLIQNLGLDGTSFTDILGFIQRHIHPSAGVLLELKLPVDNERNIVQFFNFLFQHYPDNCCIIAKLNRHPDKSKRPANCFHSTPGHSVVFSIENNQIFTIDPYISTKREATMAALPKIVKHFSEHCYLTVSLPFIRVAPPSPPSPPPPRRLPPFPPGLPRTPHSLMLSMESKVGEDVEMPSVDDKDNIELDVFMEDFVPESNDVEMIGLLTPVDPAVQF